MSQSTLAFLPLSDANIGSIVLATVRQLLQSNQQQFTTKLSQTFVHRLGANCLDKIASVKNRACPSLIMRHAKCYLQQCVVLISDTTHTIHPLAGQRLNLKIMNAAGLAALPKKNNAQQHDLGLPADLRRFERKNHNFKMLTAMEGFKHLFCNQNPFLRVMRNFGLTVTNKMSIIRHKSIHEAMGLEMQI